MSRTRSSRKESSRAVTPGEARISVHPASALIDTPLTIRASGLPPRGRCTIRSRAESPGGAVWSAAAEYQADPDGRLDLAKQPPVAARFSEADPMGLTWSMEPAGGDRGAEPLVNPPLVDPGNLEPIHIDFDLEMNGTVAATARAQRLQVAPGVERIEVSDNGVEGVLFLPAVGDGPHPTVIFLGGAEGGVTERDPALLASRGFAAFALPYFNYGELPEWLFDIPLEYFDAAIDLLKMRGEVDERRLGVIGSSRGGELALLLASMHSELRAVVGRAASGVLWYGLPHDTAHGFRPTWTRNGEAPPFMAGDFQPFEGLEADVEAGRPVSYAKAFARHLAFDEEMVRRAEIPVERINAPILLISGGDDHVWPSGDLSQIAIRRLERAGFSRPFRHISYPDAGHGIHWPYVPTTINTVTTPDGAYTISFGGEAEANYRAGVDSWHRTLAFLRRYL